MKFRDFRLLDKTIGAKIIDIPYTDELLLSIDLNTTDKLIMDSYCASGENWDNTIIIEHRNNKCEIFHIIFKYEPKSRTYPIGFWKYEVVQSNSNGAGRNRDIGNYGYKEVTLINAIMNVKKLIFCDRLKILLYHCNYKNIVGIPESMLKSIGDE